MPTDQTASGISRPRPRSITSGSPGIRRDHSDAGNAAESSIGLQRTKPPQLAYSVLILADDIGDAVASAGGWISDRVRAGWHVSALVPAESDTTALRILGVFTEAIATETNATIAAAPPATIALRAAPLQLPGELAKQVRALLENKHTEIAAWGDGTLDCARRLHAVRHRLSPTAVAFKTHALRAAGRPATPTFSEPFRGCAPWYRPDGVDLEPLTRAIQYRY